MPWLGWMANKEKTPPLNPPAISVMKFWWPRPSTAVLAAVAARKTGVGQRPVGAVVRGFIYPRASFREPWEDTQRT